METTFAYNIEKLLQKKLAVYNELTALLESEKNYIVKMDVNSLWSASTRKKELASDIERVRNSIIFLLNEQNIEHGMDSKSFDVAALIKALPISDKERANLEMLKIAIEGKKGELRQLASLNKKYIQDYLGVIDGVISTITGGAKQQSYGRRGLSVSTVAPSFYGTRFGRGAATTLLSARA
ncbi:MAG: flagellar export chaperone FlgN [Desulfamplus sp.]|nr:flagellar export chaperone FlgN [Desulfamplus sp.]